MVYMHWREASLQKASNTAKLVPLLLDQGYLVSCGDVDQEATLYHQLEHDPRTVVLYPADDSSTICEVLRPPSLADSATGADSAAAIATADRAFVDPEPGKLSGGGGDERDDRGGGDEAVCRSTTSDAGDERKQSSAAAATHDAGGAWTIVLLDGTWKQARYLNKVLPKQARRVALSCPPTEALGSLVTRWAHPEKENIQSFAAVIAALTETGLPDADAAALTAKLGISVDAYYKQVQRLHLIHWLLKLRAPSC